MKHVVFALVLLAAPAHACLNNSDTVVSEQEFNKRYEASEVEAEIFDGLPFVSALGGVALLLTGAAIARHRMRG